MTGVQTCALPIYPLLRPLHGPSDRRHHPIGDATTILTQGETAIFFSGVFGIVRSGIAAGFAALSRSLAPKVAGVAEEAIARRVSAAGLNKVETEVLRRFFRSGGKELQGVSEDVLLKYRRVAEEAMLGAGGKRVTETVLRVQTERIRLIDEALRALKQ